MAAPALWQAELAPAMILLDPVPQSGDALRSEDIERGKTSILDRTCSEGRYLVLAFESGVQRLLFRNCDSLQGLACSVLTGPTLELRVAALRQFHEALHRTSPVSAPTPLVPTPFQQSRLNLMLRIIDYLDRYPSNPAQVREVARNIVYPHSRFANASEWKSSSERRRTQRVIAEARFLVEKGYISLLQGKMPN